MLKRIRLSDVELGMFIHKLEGSWFKHPFWKSRFLLEDAAMLADLQDSGIDGVVIDISKGLDVRPLPVRASDPAPPPPVRSTVRTMPQRARAAAPDPQADLRSTAPQTMAREFGRAGVVAGKGRRVVSRIFLESRLGKAIRTDQVEPVIEDIFSSIQRNPHAFNGLMRCKRDNEYVYRHALAVSALMISLARHIRLPSRTIREAGMAGLLMDVGIGHLPVDLTAYGGDFRNLPHDILKRHVELGHAFLEAGGDMPQGVLDVALQHHETIDGSGYPLGLKGEQIALLSRMAAICDTYDSMVSDTAEGVGVNPATAIGQMNFMKGWFDPEIMQQFIETMGVYPIGSVVRLRSGLLGMVIDQNPSDYTRPRVRAFYSIPQQRLITARDIDLADCWGEEDIVGAEDPANFGVGDFAPMREKLFAGAAKAKKLAA